MDSDLEKELACSICTEILYQPLTLLDCLHTFCGSCVKDWFGWQKTNAEASPNGASRTKPVFTCPSCRAEVRETRHSATFATLVDMYLSANPDKAKSEQDKEEMRAKYKPGDNVLPKVSSSHRSSEERRAQEMERRMVERARELSLQDAGVRESSEHRSGRRRRETGASEDLRTRPSRDTSRDATASDGRDRSSRPEGRRRRTDSGNMLHPDGSSDERRRRRSESQQRSPASSTTRTRAIEHQASIRSLISSSDVDSRDLEREIEDFARQIQEEGLLDGLDLDNLDITQNDELSRKVTEAYRRRQRERERERERSRHNHSRRNTGGSRPEQGQNTPRHPATETVRQSSRQRSSSANERPGTSSSRQDDRTRPPLASTHLEVHGDSDRRRRRRNSSGARSATDPVQPRDTDVRPAARSSSDLTATSRGSDPIVQRPVFADNRSNSLPSASNTLGPSFSMRASAAQNSGPQHTVTQPTQSGAPDAASGPTSAPSAAAEQDEDGGGRARRTQRPEISVVPQNPLPSLGLLQSPVQYGHQRSRSQYYNEPSITCSQCAKPHIEYEVHYNCSKCSQGNWNLCLDCYRTGKGCMHWFGFGYTAFKRWEKAQADAGGEHIDPPHMLTSNRYRPPRAAPGGADGRRTMTTEDPATRFESGMFCARCLAWSNECYWRCDTCNEGDWGFCNNCVNQGYSCTHPLLPLSYVKPATGRSQSPPGTPPRSPRRPLSAQLFTGPNALSIGNFKPLTFTTTCDICHDPIAPTQMRHHCYTCTSTVVPDTHPGDYDICIACHNRLVEEQRLSEENGPAGWRRCLNGHRMAVIGFEESRGAQRRIVARDLVGGRDMKVEPVRGADGSTTSNLQKWRWMGPNGKTRAERLVTVDVAATAPPLAGSNAAAAETFPPDGGSGKRAVAGWSWYPAPDAEDELLFPRGADIREVHDINGDWYSGTYMGVVGLVPSPYVKIVDA